MGKSNQQTKGSSGTNHPTSTSSLHTAPESVHRSQSASSKTKTTLTTSSPGSVPTTVTVRDAGSPDLQAVSELLGTMKLTLSALGATFDTLGNQTVKVAELGPAIEATHQIQLLRQQMSDQQMHQEERMQEVKKLLSEELKNQLRDHLATQVDLMVKECIQKEVAERVRYQFKVKIPESLQEEVNKYKRHILSVKTSLHNSEARRHNALIRLTALEEPLRPLLRTASMPRKAMAASSPSVTSSKSLSMAKPAASQAGLAAESQLDFEPPTPSPLFPRDLTSLIALEPGAVRTLMDEYGLADEDKPLLNAAQPRDKRAKPANVAVRMDNTREENLNRFMSYIGVGFQLVPTTPTQGGKPQPHSPLMTRVPYSLIH